MGLVDMIISIIVSIVLIINLIFILYLINKSTMYINNSNNSLLDEIRRLQKGEKDSNK